MKSDQPGDAPMISMDEAFLRRLEKAIDENLENPDFGVDELGKEIGVSRSQLHRKVHDLTGKSTSRFIRSHKLAKAKSLLEKRVATVSEVSYQLGFSSPAYFSQVFQEEFGYPPRETSERLAKKTGLKKSNAGRTVPLIIGVIVLLAAISWILFQTAHPQANDSSKNTLVVLPFVDINQNKEEEYFSYGITEDLISQLAKIPELKIISRTSSMLYKNTDKSVKDIAKELNVAYVVEGSVRRSTDNIRIVVQLIDAETDTHIWTATLDRKITETLTLQSEIANEVARQLKYSVPRPVTDFTVAYGSIPPEVYDRFLRGRFLLYQFTKEATYKAIELFEQTIAIDSTFAPAYAWLGAAYITLGSWAGDLSRAEAYPKSKYYLDKALSLDPHLAKAHSTLAYQKFFYEWDFKGGEEEYLLAYRLDPSDIINISGYHHLLNMAGRFDEAREWWERGNKIDPFSLWNFGYMGTTFFFLGEESNAVDFYARAVDNFPFAQILHDKLGWVYLNVGHYDSAVAVVERSFRKFGTRPATSVATLSMAYFYSGRLKESEALVNELHTAYSRGERGMCFYLAVTAGGMGKTEEALDWLEKAFDRKEVEMIWLKVTPQFKSIQGHPRFTRLASALSD